MSSPQKKSDIQNYKLRIVLPASLTESQAISYALAFGEIDATASTIIRADHDELDPWHLDWYCPERPDESEIKNRIAILSETMNDVDIEDWAVEAIPGENWLEYSYRQFAPFAVGSFFIYGSHYDGHVPDGQIGLQIDAATAFGSGEHGTTAGCLQALEELHKDGFAPDYVLDMGTGSGILAIAACKLWDIPVLAPDIDEEAVHVTERHVLLNKIPEHLVESLQSEGFAAPEIAAKAPYPLIIANILAAPLKDMAQDLTDALEENGLALLSGILDHQAESVITRYTECGLVTEKTYPVDEWVSILMKKK